MGTTSKYAWPYPELTDPPDGASQIKALAVAIDATVKNVDEPPLLQCESGTAQSFSSAAWTAIQFNINVVDTHAMHSTVTNNTRIVAAVKGWYQVGGGCSWVSNATGKRGLMWYLNGAIHTPTAVYAPAPAGGSTGLAAPTIVVQLNIGNYVELWAYQDSGVALACGNGPGSRPYANARFIRATP
jgi:hypothetical protein